MSDGLAARFSRFSATDGLLKRRLLEMGLDLLAPVYHRAPVVTAFEAVSGRSEAFNCYLLWQHGIHISADLINLRAERSALVTFRSGPRGTTLNPSPGAWRLPSVLIIGGPSPNRARLP